MIGLKPNELSIVFPSPIPCRLRYHAELIIISIKIFKSAQLGVDHKTTSDIPFLFRARKEHIKKDLMKNSPNQNQRLVSQPLRPQKPRRVKSTDITGDDEIHKVVHDYHDHSQVTFSAIDTDLQGSGDKPKGPRGGVTVPFPTKLHVMLSKVEENDLSHIISW